MDFEIIDEKTGKVVGHDDCGCTSKDEVIAGLAEINAFCEVFIKEYNCGNDVIKKWKEYTDEAIKFINKK